MGRWLLRLMQSRTFWNASEAHADLRKDPTNDARSRQGSLRRMSTPSTSRSSARHCKGGMIKLLSKLRSQVLTHSAAIGNRQIRHWTQLQYIWIPSDLLLCRLGKCRVMVGMRKSQTIVDEDGFWLRGHDGAHEYVSVALGRNWRSLFFH